MLFFNCSGLEAEMRVNKIERLMSYYYVSILLAVGFSRREIWQAATDAARVFVRFLITAR